MLEVALLLTQAGMLLNPFAAPHSAAAPQAGSRVRAPVIQRISVSRDGRFYTVKWSQSGATPSGGFDVIIDGKDSNGRHRTRQTSFRAGPLKPGRHCFQVEARHTRQAIYKVSARKCATPDSGGRGGKESKLRISGKPDGSVRVGDTYRFTPAVDGSGGRRLRFSITNKPAWARFDSKTGKLRGKPRASHVRTWTNIRITASDGRKSARLPAFSIRVTSQSTGGGESAPTISKLAWQGNKVRIAWKHRGPKPDNGFDIVINGKDTNQKYRTKALSALVGPLNRDRRHCFAIEARFTRARSFPNSPEACIGGNGSRGGAGNRPPSISGDPATSVAVGETYGFTPRSKDPDGDTLTFSIKNKPAWANFDRKTGRLSGKPKPGDARRYKAVRISVSDGKSATSLASFDVQVVQAGDKAVTVSWTPPTQREDGSPLKNLAGYRIFVGRSRDTLDRVIDVRNAGLSSYVVDNLTDGKWFFAVHAYDRQGLESRKSAPVSARAR